MLLSTLPEQDIIIATLSDNGHLTTGVLNIKDKIAELIAANGRPQTFIIDATRTSDLTIAQIMTALSAVTVEGPPMRLVPQIKEMAFAGTSEKIRLVITNIAGIALGPIRTFDTVEEALSHFRHQD